MLPGKYTGGNQQISTYHERKWASGQLCYTYQSVLGSHLPLDLSAHEDSSTKPTHYTIHSYRRTHHWYYRKQMEN